MRSFQRAVELGCAMVECDVRRALDGVLVLAHDGHVTDAKGRTYVIAEHAGEVLQRLDLGAGEGTPTLPELARWAQGRCAIMADMKCEGMGVEQAVAQALEALPVEAKIVPGAGEESRRVFRTCAPDLPLSLSMNAWEGNLRLAGGGFARLLSKIDTRAVTWEHPLLTAARIAALHAQGLHVYAWTVDDPQIMRRLIADGVDGIISNRPELFERVMR